MVQFWFQVEDVDPLVTIFIAQFWFQVEDMDPLVGELWAPLASSDKLSDSHHGSEVKQKKVKGAE
jgi:hypothetical protein